MIKCYGVIAVREGKEILLVHHVKGHWGFPKGHSYVHETGKEAAERELEEETGLHIVRFFDTPPLEERYEVEGEPKLVTYYMAEVDGMVDLQEEEIQNCRWLSFDEGKKLATFAATRKLIASVQQLTSHT